MNNPIRRSCAPLSDEQLAAAETELGLDLPDAYRDFLRQRNGGLARRVTFHFTNKKGRSQEAWLGWIYPVGHEGKLDPADAELIAAYKARPRGLREGMLPVAETWYLGNTGTICIACTGPDAGKVFLRPEVDPDKPTLYAVADSWPAFLDGMTFMDGKEKRWMTLVHDADVAGLRELLERSKKWQDNAGLQSEIEQEAVAEGHWPIVELLLEKGWSATDLFEHAMGSRRLDLALALLQTEKVEAGAIEACLTESDGILWYALPFVEELVRRGADVGHQDVVGETPLHKAVTAGSLDGVRFLVERGADPTVQNDDGRTPAALGQRLEEPALVAVLRDAEKAWAKRPIPLLDSLEVAELDFHGVEMRKAGEPVRLADIALFEREAGVELPAEYRGFLTKANGGYPDPDRCALPDPSAEHDEDRDEEDDEHDRGLPAVSFAPLFPSHGLSREEFYERMTQAHESGEKYPDLQLSVQEHLDNFRGTGAPRRMIPIGNVEDYGYSGGWLLLSCKGRDKGKLYYRDGCLESHEDGTWPLVDSLDALFRLLGEEKRRPPSPQDLAERAIKANDVIALREALWAGARPDKATRSGLSLMRVAMDAKNDEAVWAMVEAGADLSETFADAANFGLLGVARRMLGHGKGPAKKALRGALLTYGVYADADFVKELIARGALEPSKKAKARGQTAMQAAMAAGGWTPLHAACVSGHVEGIRVLLDAGLDVNARTGEGGTPLAVVAGSHVGGKPVEVVKLLLERAAKVNQPDCQGRTALHAAVERGDLETAKLLIEAGEDLNARHDLSIPGMSPEKQAKVARESAKAMQDMMKMLGDMHADDDLPPIDTSTPLGETLAKAQEAIGERMKEITSSMGGRLDELMSSMASGGMGKGPSALEAGKRRVEGQAILAELEAYQARVRKPSIS